MQTSRAALKDWAAYGCRGVVHAASAGPERRLGCRDISSTSKSAHGQNEATLLNGAFDSRSTRRHFSFDVHVLQMRHATAKLSSVRGSTIALKSIPARLATDTNSSVLDWWLVLDW
jgi:hypothetical protein